MVVKEKIIGGKQDSLFFGIYLGQDKNEYFDEMWKLNNQQIIMQGTNSYEVLRHSFRKYKDSVTIDDLIMEFSPKFDTLNKIRGLDLIFTKSGWSIWNKKYHAETILPEVIDSIQKWFPGNNFIEYQTENEETSTPVFLKLDGNRLFKAYYKDNTEVKVDLYNINN